MNLLLFYLFMALGISFLCSLLEAVLLSITPGFAESTEYRSPRTGAILRKLKENIDRPLSAILTLNTMAHTIGAAGVGAQALLLFGSESIAIVSAILTILILVLSEIIPKTLGALYWRKLAPLSAYILKWLIILLYPLVLLFMKLTQIISRGKVTHSISYEELVAIADIGYKEGLFREQESKIIKNLLLLRKLKAYDIMTPHTVMFKLPADMTIGEVVAKFPDIMFSRIPIYRNNPDEIDSFVLKSDIYMEASRNNQDKMLNLLRRDLPAIPETVTLIQLFEQCLKQRQYINLVVDEHGGIAGILTMEDIIETLLGIEIVDETDLITDMRAMARQQWQKRARKLGLITDHET
ncbi:MAG: CNNM domain-containing protein [Desulfobacterales bacterium]